MQSCVTTSMRISTQITLCLALSPKQSSTVKCLIELRSERKDYWRMYATKANASRKPYANSKSLRVPPWTRIKEAENNAFANIHQPRHVFEQQLMDEYKELKRGFAKETEELRKAAAKTRSEIESLGRARTPKWKVAALMLITLVLRDGPDNHSFQVVGGQRSLASPAPPLTTIP